jgi:hypothetical protein
MRCPSAASPAVCAIEEPKATNKNNSKLPFNNLNPIGVILL